MYREMGRFTRAFYNANKGLFVDFDYYKRQLKGYLKIYRLIDFAFTVEHELQHVKQRDEFSKGTLTYNNLQITKDCIVLIFMDGKDDTLSQYFYHNAHNSLFLELDANNQAIDFVSKQLTSRNLNEIIVETYGDKRYSVNDALEDRKNYSEVRKGVKGQYIYDMIFGLNNLKQEANLKIHPEKIVNIITDNLVRQNPTEFFNEYPILNSVYNEDGTKKTYYEIKEIVKSKPETSSFYNQVIANDALLRIQKIESDMFNQYCSMTDNDEKQQVLDNGLKQIRELIKNEAIDLDNILVYFDKRVNEIENSDNIKLKDTSKLIFYMIKRYILEHQDTIRNAFFRTSEYKEELLTCQKILSQKCGIDFNSERIKVDITSLIFYLKHDHLYKKYSSQGYNSDEIN